MGNLIQLPQFVHEAYEGEQTPDARELADVLELGIASLLPPIEPTAAALARLQTTLAQPPQRYAPFFARLAQLFDLSEDATIAELTRLASPNAWRFAGLAGIHNVVVRGGPAVASAETLLVRFAPGTRFPRHRHLGSETTLVLEGHYTDSEGIIHRAGEQREWTEGTEHSFRVGRSEPCIFASVTFGRRFSAPPLRLLARVLGR